jgi:serine/threonine protein kinase
VLRGHDSTAASDVFSLACVLVYAARGTGPFGKGDPLAVAHRTVAEPPDLSGAPEAVRTLVAPLLDADPTLRPTPAQLLKQVSGLAGTAVLHGGTWLPVGVRDLLAQRQAEAQKILGESAGAQDQQDEAQSPELATASRASGYPVPVTQTAAAAGWGRGGRYAAVALAAVIAAVATAMR